MPNGFSKTSGNSLVNGDDNCPTICPECGETLDGDGICNNINCDYVEPEGYQDEDEEN